MLWNLLLWNVVWSQTLHMIHFLAFSPQFRWSYWVAKTNYKAALVWIGCFVESYHIRSYITLSCKYTPIVNLFIVKSFQLKTHRTKFFCDKRYRQPSIDCHGAWRFDIFRGQPNRILKRVQAHYSGTHKLLLSFTILNTVSLKTCLLLIYIRGFDDRRKES